MGSVTFVTVCVRGQGGGERRRQEGRGVRARRCGRSRADRRSSQPSRRRRSTRHLLRVWVSDVSGEEHGARRDSSGAGRPCAKDARRSRERRVPCLAATPGTPQERAPSILQQCVVQRAAVRRVAKQQAGRVQRWRVAACETLPACAPIDEPATPHSPPDCGVLRCGMLQCEEWARVFDAVAGSRRVAWVRPRMPGAVRRLAVVSAETRRRPAQRRAQRQFSRWRVA